MSAIEWAASASMAEEPETTPATSLATAIDALAASATSTVRRAALRRAAAGHQREPLRAAAASATSARDEAALLVGLGVPLDAEREAAVGRLEGLGQLVDRRPAGDLEALADAVDGLVVVGLRAVDDLAGGARGQRAVGQAHVVVGAVEGARVAPVLVVAVALGQVLQQRAAGGDVHELHPAADAQQREVALQRAAGERDLEVVALGDRAAGLGVRLLPVGGRDRCRRRRPG